MKTSRLGRRAAGSATQTKPKDAISPAPSLISQKTSAISAADLHNIANGKGHVPKYGEKLSSQDIDTLVQQIQTLNKK